MEKESWHEISRLFRLAGRLGKAMRLTVMLVCVSVSSLFANASAQSMRVDLKVEDKSLVEVMDILKAQTGYSFVYSAGDVENVRGITLDVRDMTVTEVLDIVLEGTNLTYKIEDDLIILKKAPALYSGRLLNHVSARTRQRAGRRCRPRRGV